MGQRKAIKFLIPKKHTTNAEIILDFQVSALTSGFIMSPIEWRIETEGYSPLHGRRLPSYRAAIWILWIS